MLKPSDYYFEIVGEAESGEGIAYMVLVEKYFWNQNKCLDDAEEGENVALPPEISPVPLMEATFELTTNEDEARNAMLAAGFTEKKLL